MFLLSTPLTFDRVARSAIFIGIVAIFVLLVRYLSPVLVPFFLAWALAWALVPIVDFYDRRCHIPYRSMSIFFALFTVVLAIVAVVAAVAPIFVEGYAQFKVAVKTVVGGNAVNSLPDWMQRYLDEYGRGLHLNEVFSRESVMNSLRGAVPRLSDIIQSTVAIIMGLFSAFFALLYLVFILKDYDKFSTGWINFVPRAHRPFLTQVAGEFGMAMRNYLRGQSLVALSNVVMFSIGFWIIGLKMWLPMGIFVGLISFVPYIQIAGFVPAAVLAFLETMQGGRPFFLTFFLVGVVYLVVQIIQDAVVTPRVMGKVMGLSPAIVLLALMVWGYIGGIVGLIIALPLTTTLVAYYKRYVIGEDPKDE